MKIIFLNLSVLLIIIGFSKAILISENEQLTGIAVSKLYIV